MRDTTLSGKPSMPSAWSAQVHGPVRPLDYPGRRIMRTISAMRAEEARLARQAEERAEPGMLKGTAYALCTLLCLGAWMGGIYLIFGGS